MKRTLFSLLVVWACPWVAAAQTPAGPPPTAAARPAPEKLAADTPRTTAGGATFTAPREWSITVDGATIVLLAPDGDSRIAIVESSATEPDAAVAAAWESVRPGVKRALRLTTPAPGRDGWDEQRNYSVRDLAERASRRRCDRAAARHDLDGLARRRRAGDLRPARGPGRARPAEPPAEGLHRGVLRGPEGPPARSRARQAAHRLPGERDAGTVGARRRARDRRQRHGRVRRRIRRARAGQAREGRRRHDVHDRVEHQAAHDAVDGQPRRRRQARLGHAGDEGLPRLQARRRRHHAAGARQAPAVCVHGAAAAGLRMAVRVQGRDAGLGDAHARRHAADHANSATCSSTAT